MRKNKLIQIRVSEDQKKEIESLAAKRGLNTSELILFSLMRLLAEDNINLAYKY
ncbi:plasmid mobilization protein [Clostridium sardiniense]|uniref:plasmid mobilization protein n=1 Tax=Clostridium sardiniense TaxID=29369 RepID=UPI003D349F8D